MLPGDVCCRILDLGISMDIMRGGGYGPTDRQHLGSTASDRVKQASLLQDFSKPSACSCILCISKGRFLGDSLSQTYSTVDLFCLDYPEGPMIHTPLENIALRFPTL